jgi:hypothetical protein
MTHHVKIWRRQQFVGFRGGVTALLEFNTGAGGPAQTTNLRVQERKNNLVRTCVNRTLSPPEIYAINDLKIIIIIIIILIYQIRKKLGAQDVVLDCERTTGVATTNG